MRVAGLVLLVLLFWRTVVPDLWLGTVARLLFVERLLVVGLLTLLDLPVLFTLGLLALLVLRSLVLLVLLALFPLGRLTLERVLLALVTLLGLACVFFVIFGLYISTDLPETLPVPGLLEFVIRCTGTDVRVARCISALRGPLT